MNCEHCGSPAHVRPLKVYRLGYRPMATLVPLCAGCYDSNRRREIIRLVLGARIKA